MTGDSLAIVVHRSTRDWAETLPEYTTAVSGE